jgi:4-hydroxy-tetrahydrodipicolinate synthase
VLGEILTAICTPFKADGSVDYDAFRALASHLVANGSDGLVVTGTTGESPTLSDGERFALYEAALDEVGDRATVVAGTGTYSTHHSVELTRRAHELGVHGFLVVTPYYNKPPVRGVVEHFKTIAAESDRPIVAYNIPGRVIVHLDSAAIAQLAEIPTVRAVKQAYPDLVEAKAIVDLGLDLYAGDDHLLLDFLELGGVGGICVRSHIAGRQMKQMVSDVRRGDIEDARRIDRELAPLWELDGVAVNPIPIKTALGLLGHDVGGFRLPLVSATPEEHEQVRDCLERAGLLAPVAA